MKSTLLLVLALATMITSYGQDDKSKRPSPPATLTATLKSGAVIKIDYSAPSVKGRTIGKDLEPKDDTVWRTGANEATVFETSKDIKVEGKTLPAGKYSLFTISGAKEWTIIFNKTWSQWGAYEYDKSKDALRVKVPAGTASSFAEKMNFAYDKSNIILTWGNKKVSFKVE